MSTSDKKVILKCNDNTTFEVDLVVAMQSLTIKNMVEDVPDAEFIPLLNVSGEILSKVIEYCKNHAGSLNSNPDKDAVEEELRKFDEEFVMVDMDTLFGLILAANYLNIKELLDLVAQAIADRIKDIEEPEEIRRLCHIENDFTPEEEAALREENAWAFEE